MIEFVFAEWWEWVGGGAMCLIIFFIFVLFLWACKQLGLFKSIEDVT